MGLSNRLLLTSILSLSANLLSRHLNWLLGAHRRRDTSIDHSVLQTLECRTLLDLRLLKFAKEFVLKSLQLEALLLEVIDFTGHVVSLHLDIISGLSPLILNEFILFGHALRLGLPDLLLTELSLIVVIFTHSVQVVLDLLLLSTNFLDRGHLLIDEVFVSDCELLFLFFLALALGHSLLLFLSLSILLFSPPLENDVVVLSLQVL